MTQEKMKLTAGAMRKWIESLDDEAEIQITGWQGINTLTVYESWKTDGNLRITVEEIN